MKTKQELQTQLEIYQEGFQEAYSAKERSHYKRLCRETCEEIEANARLIAAAPELLAMLQRVRRNGGIDKLSQFDEIDALLAKATTN